ncbi:MAG: redoxin domain-containing protein [Cellvibrionaceae bacterium]|nr:redoxin domain-containing protein [Cellvibrionaceae bacterium]
MAIKKFAKIICAGVALGLAATVAVADPVVGKAAPAFSGKTADGSQVDLASLRGKTVVLEWTNHECPYVVKHYEKSGNIPKLQKEATEDGIVWLQVISSAPGKQGHVDGATAVKLNENRGAQPSGVILDSDGAIGKLYAAQTSPHLFIINPQGVLEYKGGIDSIKSAKEDDIAKATNYVREALDALAEGKKVPHPSTAPYGCSIKYAS